MSAIRRPPRRPLDLTAQGAELVAQQEHLGLWVPDPQSDVRDIKN